MSFLIIHSSPLILGKVVLTREQVEQALACQTEFQAMLRLKDMKLPREDQTMALWMVSLQKDNAGGWPYIQRAISRNLMNVAVEMTRAYTINDRDTYDRLVKQHDLKSST